MIDEEGRRRQRENESGRDDIIKKTFGRSVSQLKASKQEVRRTGLCMLNDFNELIEEERDRAEEERRDEETKEEEEAERAGARAIRGRRQGKLIEELLSIGA